jgi:tryptophanyl-tRNA synthetase
LASGNEGKKRVVSGMRPTGRLHIGHYFGALQNWVRLQDDPGYDCFYFIADWHALTSDYADTSAVAQNTIEITTDYLASGLDPDKSVIFQQSQVPEHAELHLLLSMVTPLGWLERVPTYKEALENIQNKDLHTYGFLGYPTLQTADIVIYSEEGVPLLVPVGEDQVSHVELSREIVRRFLMFYGLGVDSKLFEVPNRTAAQAVWMQALDLGQGSRFDSEAEIPQQNRFIMEMMIRGGALHIGLENFFTKLSEHARMFFQFREVLTEPQVMLTQTPRIPGLDGRKMSKSYGNAITLSESDADIRAKTKVMKTDPARQRRTDAGNPEVCPVYDWHKLFSPAETLEWAAAGCRSAGIGCIDCKSKMADHLIQWIAPVRERRVEYEKHPRRVLEILDAGSKRARTHAQQTMERVREAVFGWKRKREEIQGAFTEVHDTHG